LAISRNIQARHLPHGTMLDPVFAGPHSDRIVGYTRAGDSAIWTGHYLAAESFRYKVRRDPEALTSIRVALSGIERLIDVTGSGFSGSLRARTHSNRQKLSAMLSGRIPNNHNG